MNYASLSKNKFPRDVLVEYEINECLDIAIKIKEKIFIFITYYK